MSPEFWSDEKMVECEFVERLFFAGLWTFCDDHGYIEYKPMKFKLQIFPADDLRLTDMVRMSQHLVTLGCLEYLVCPESQVLRVVHWDKYQHPQHPAASKLMRSDLERCTVLPNPHEDS
jgi:hypothetical protein